MHPSLDHANEDLWVFAYGSLIWRPGFDHLERVPARLIGAHRALCVYSFVHRGTPERPGLVLGLDHGGMCRGVAYRVAARRRTKTLDYLREREQVTTVYIERVRPVVLIGHAEARIQAVCYMVDRSHPQYAGKLSLMEQLRIVRHGHGKSGANRDYVLSTVHALEAMDCRDRDLHLLAERLHGIHEVHGEAVHAGTG
jgi:glutathione-specific gamma-glutamylcyclotransferase